MDLTKFDAAREKLRAAKEMLKEKKRMVRVALDEEEAAQIAVDKEGKKAEIAFYSAGGVGVVIDPFRRHGLDKCGPGADVNRRASSESGKAFETSRKSFAEISPEANVIMELCGEFQRATDETRAGKFALLFDVLRRFGIVSDKDNMVYCCMVGDYRCSGYFLNTNGQWKELLV